MHCLHVLSLIVLCHWVTVYKQKGLAVVQMKGPSYIYQLGLGDV